MAIRDIPQPGVIQICDDLRLRCYDGEHRFALSWYQDEELVWLVDGVRVPYNRDMLDSMYRWLSIHGELYFIEVMKDGGFSPIGDVTLMRNNLPIVIADPEFRGCGIGKKVLSALIERAKALGFETLGVREIYSYNLPSQRLFLSAGFCESGRTEKGSSYTLTLKRL